MVLMAELSKHTQHKNVELIRLLQSSSKTGFAESDDDDPKDNKWTDLETQCLLKLISEYDYYSQLTENDQVYIKLSKLMTVSGHSKTKDEIKDHWLSLTQKYEAYNNGTLEGFKYLEELRELVEPKVILIKGEQFNDDFVSSLDICSKEFKYNKGLKRNIWSERETDCVMEVLEKYGMPTRTNLRKMCYVIADYLNQQGYTRNEEQVQIKIKQLRLLYNQVIRKTMNEIDFPFFKRLHVLMQVCDAPKISNNTTRENQNYIIMNEDDVHQEHSNHVAVKYKGHLSEDCMVQRKGRQIWSNTEVSILISFVEENGIVTGKQLSKLCDKAVEYLASYGYARTPSQILVRWKNTKAVYWSTLRKNLASPEKECAFFYRLEAILNRDDNNIEGDESVDKNDELFNHNLNEISNDSGRSRSNSTDNFVAFDSSVDAKREHMELHDPLGNVDCSSPVELTSPSPKRNRLHYSLDSIDHYCMSLSPSIKKLDYRKQAKLKIEIQKLLYQAEFDSDF